MGIINFTLFEFLIDNIQQVKTGHLKYILIKCENILCFRKQNTKSGNLFKC